MITNTSIWIKISLFGIIFCWTACKQSTNVPSDVLNVKKMALLMTDIYLLEAKLNTIMLPRDTTEIMFNHLHRLILDKHVIDSATYIRSMQFYLDEPVLFMEVNSIVVDSLSVREKTMQIN